MLIRWIVILILSLSAFYAHAKQVKPTDVYTLTSSTSSQPEEISLNWQSSNPNNIFDVQRSYNGIDFITISKVGAGATAYLDTALNYQVRYWYRLVGHNLIDGTTQVSNISNTTTQSALPASYPISRDTFDSDAIDSKWVFVGGNWTQSNGILQQTNNQTINDIEKAILNDQSYPLDQTITAKLMVTSWAEGGGNHVGVGIFTDPITGGGYQLVFHHKNQVQFVNDDIVWGNSYSFPWELNKWYWFKLTRHTDALLGKIWADGAPEPTDWMFTQSGWSDRTRGNPALDGGGFKGGFSTAVFDSAIVTGSKTYPDPFSIGGDPSVHPSDFAITTFTKGLNYPKSMQQLFFDDSLLVATSDPVGSNGNFFNSSGTILRFFDDNKDGIADGPGQILYSGLPGALNSLRVIDNILVVTSSQPQKESIWIFQFDKTFSHINLLGTLYFAFPAHWSHTTYALAARKIPGSNPTGYEIFFNVGSQYNNKADDQLVALSGSLGTQNISGSSIYRFKIKPTLTGFVMNDLQLIANGLRNAAGMTFDPINGDLLLEDNGIDFPDYPSEPLSADSLYRISFSSIGNTIFNFGFPNSYIAYRTNLQVGNFLENPALAVFQPWPDNKVGEESEGPVEIATAPGLFPYALNNGTFITFFGRSGLAGLANEENPLVFYDNTTKKYFHFINSYEPKIGHLSGILSTNDSLFLADLSENGDITTSRGTGAGVIYQIKAIH